jgi:hypothetical protein
MGFIRICVSLHLNLRRPHGFGMTLTGASVGFFLIWVMLI